MATASSGVYTPISNFIIFFFIHILSYLSSSYLFLPFDILFKGVGLDFEGRVKGDWVAEEGSTAAADGWWRRRALYLLFQPLWFSFSLIILLSISVCFLSIGLGAQERKGEAGL